jgi:hypothetical protein
LQTESKSDKNYPIILPLGYLRDYDIIAVQEVALQAMAVCKLPLLGYPIDELNRKLAQKII